MSKVLSDEDLIKAANGLIWVNCENLHKNSCLSYWIKCTLHSLIFSLKLYIPLNLVSALFKLKAFLQNPKESLIQILKSSLRSSSCLSAMILFTRIIICTYVSHIHKGDSKAMLLASFSVMPCVFIEKPTTISNFTIYVLPRFLDALWKFLNRRLQVPKIPYFQVLLFCISNSAVSYGVFCEKDIVKSSLNFLWQRFLGLN